MRPVASAFVTGGSGFIGGRLIERLVADGYGVRALARSDRAAERVRARGAEPERGDLADPSPMRAGALGLRACVSRRSNAGRLGDARGVPPR